MRIVAAKPPRYFTQKPRRLPERKRVVTIAAGFRFAGGIVLFADSEEATGDSVKVSVQKIEVVDKKFSKLLFAGAGSADMVNRAIEEITAQIGPRYTHQAIREVIERTVSTLYGAYVYPTPGDDKPYFELLVAYHTAKGSDFVKISRSATVRPAHYDVIGLGLLHAAHMMDRSFRPNMGQVEALMLAVYVLQQTKRYVPYCGGPSQICILRPDGAVEWISEQQVRAFENFADRFDRAMRNPFLCCLDPDVSDADYQRMFEQLRSSVFTYRRFFAKPEPDAFMRVFGPSVAIDRKPRQLPDQPKDSPKAERGLQRSKRGRKGLLPSRG
jgi:20S proteasome alpha/beta subunit